MEAWIATRQGLLLGVFFKRTMSILMKHALLVKFVLIKTLLAFATTLDLQIHRMDILNVFL